MTLGRAQELARHFAPVGLAELDARASLQQRMDDKYVATWEQFMLLVEHIVDTHEVLEIGGHRAFTYDSVYFDSDTLRCYNDHLQRRRRRFKCRTRRYVETDTNQLQVKLEGRRAATVKHVVNCEPDLHGAIDDEGWDFVHRIVRDAYGFEPGSELRPTLRTRYGRMTFGPPDGAERVTCDFDMALEAFGGPTGRMLEGRVILEVKSARGDGPANSLLRRLGVRPVSCSKYCVGMALTHPGVRANVYRRLLNNHFETDLGGAWHDARAPTIEQPPERPVPTLIPAAAPTTKRARPQQRQRQLRPRHALAAMGGALIAAPMAALAIHSDTGEPAQTLTRASVMPAFEWPSVQTEADARAPARRPTRTTTTSVRKPAGRLGALAGGTSERTTPVDFAPAPSRPDAGRRQTHGQDRIHDGNTSPSAPGPRTRPKPADPTAAATTLPAAAATLPADPGPPPQRQAETTPAAPTDSSPPTRAPAPPPPSTDEVPLDEP